MTVSMAVGLSLNATGDEHKKKLKIGWKSLTKFL